MNIVHETYKKLLCNNNDNQRCNGAEKFGFGLERNHVSDFNDAGAERENMNVVHETYKTLLYQHIDCLGPGFVDGYSRGSEPPTELLRQMKPDAENLTRKTWREKPVAENLARKT